MIAKMEKVSIVTLESRKDATLNGLRKLGAVHLEPCVESSDTLQELTQKRDLLEKALVILPGKKLSGTLGKPEDLGKAMQTAADIVHIREKIHSLEDERDRLGKEAETLEPWGPYTPADITGLESVGVFIGLYAATPKEMLLIPRETLLFRIGERKKKQYLAAVFRSAESRQSFPLEAIPLPARGLTEIRELIERKGAEIDGLKETIESLAPCREEIARSLAETQEQLEFEQARVSMRNEGSLCHISGFIPADRTASLKKAAAEQGWAVLLREPAEDEQVPTLLTNNRVVRIVQPVFNLLGTLPGYRERDISFFFLIFFSIFFAMIIGDGGYGFVIFLVSLYSLIKSRGSKSNDGLILIVVMSVCSMIWGAVTGTWFGIEAISEKTFLSRLVIPGLYSFDPRSSEIVQRLCFIIGTVHISIAHIWNFIRQLREKPRIRALAQLGWLSMVLGLYYLVLNLVLDPVAYPMPSFAIPMIIGGLVFVFLFANQEGKFFKGILKGLTNFLPTFLNSIGVFSDIISYIRLFAVGLASFAVADSFNSMAAGAASSGVIGLIAAAVIGLLGHGLNFAMGALSVIVHGVRLNMLEFSNHLGLEWSGFPYKPFAERENA